MLIRMLKPELKPRVRSYEQVEAYLEQRGVTQPLIRIGIEFLKHLAKDNGEVFIGTHTKMAMLENSWSITPRNLEAVYNQAPMAIRQYVDTIMSDGRTESFQQLAKPVAACSKQTQYAYVFLSEFAIRTVYAMMYEPEHIWRLVDPSENVSVISFG